MEKQKSYGACVSKERCLEILTEEVQDHLPKEKWEDYERAVNRVRYEFSKLDGGWIPVEDGVPEKPENGYQEPEYNVMIKGAIIPTTLKFTSKGKWKDDLGQEYEIIAWRPLPEPYRPERREGE